MTEINEQQKKDVKSIIERVERLEEEMAALRSDVKEVYAEAKARGLNTKAIKQVIKLRKLDPNELAELDFEINAYMEFVN